MVVQRQSKEKQKLFHQETKIYAWIWKVIISNLLCIETNWSDLKDIDKKTLESQCRETKCEMQNDGKNDKKETTVTHISNSQVKWGDKH